MDPVRDLLVVSTYSRLAGGITGLLIFRRTDSGNVEPQRVIAGPKTGITRLRQIGLDPETGRIFVAAINNEYLPINLNAVPYMITKGGQTFAKAYANTVIGYCGNGNINNLGGGNCIANANAVAPQPIFEAALSGTGYCNGFANCTQAVIAKEGIGANGTGNLSTANVWSLYSDLDNGGFNFPRSMMNTPLNCPTGTEIGCQGQLTSGVGMNASVGYGNYNALLITLKSQDWHGLTMQSNFTWSKALGTGSQVQATSAATPPDPFNLRTGYGYQAFDRRFIYNLFFVYQPHWYKSQSGLVGHLLGGWTFAPVFTTGSGLPMTLGTINGGGQVFGEGVSVNFFGYGNSENAIPLSPANLGQGSRNFVGDYLDTSNPAGLGSLPGSVANGTLTYQRQMEFGLRLSF